MHKGKILLLPILICSLNFHICYSQNSYKGYIFSHKGDTAHGFISEPEGNLPTRLCYFKPSINDDFILLRPDDILGFRVANQNYLSTKIQLYDKDTLMFVKVMFSGDYDLRYFEFWKSKNFIIRRPDHSFYYIKYPPDLTPEEVLSGHTAAKKFKQQTDSIFPDTPFLAEYQDGVTPDISSFLNLFRQYYFQTTSDRTESPQSSENKEFMKGFIIKSNRDSLNGLLGNDLKKTIHKTCIFSPGKFENSVRFLPADILGFGSNRMNMAFASANIRQGKRDTEAFVRLILDGPIDFLYYGNNGLHHFLFRDTGNQVSELIYPPVLNKKDYLSGLNSTRKFILLQDSIFSDLNIPRSRIKVKPTVKSITKILENHFQNIKEPYKVYNGRQMKLSFGVTAGVMLEKYFYNIENDGYRSFAHPAPFGGLNMNLVNRYGTGLVIRDFIGYHQYKYSYSRQLSEYTLYRQTSGKGLANTFSTGFIANPLKKLRLKPFFEAGGVARLYFNTEFENHSEEVYPDNVVFSYYDKDKMNETFFYGGFLRAGCRKPVKQTSSVSFSAGYSFLTDRGSDKVNSVDLSVTYNF